MLRIANPLSRVEKKSYTRIYGVELMGSIAAECIDLLDPMEMPRFACSTNLWRSRRNSIAGDPFPRIGSAIAAVARCVGVLSLIREDAVMLHRAQQTVLLLLESVLNSNKRFYCDPNGNKPVRSGLFGVIDELS